MTKRRQLYSLLGDLPPRRRPIPKPEPREEDRGAFLLERLDLDLNGEETVPAYFVKPRRMRRPAPAVLYNHYHGGQYQLGKDELLLAKPGAGLESYAHDLTAAGYCALCIDTWAFGGRAARTESDIFKDMLWKGQVMWGMMVYDSLRALDYLVSRPDVDSTRIATLGMSMGSTMAWWTAALDTRIKVTVDLCCLTDFDALVEAAGLSGHGLYYFVPGLRKHFTSGGINELIAPRTHLSLAGTRDPLTPPAGLDRIDRHLRNVYRRRGHSGNWCLLRYDVGHEETTAMRSAALDFLAAHL